MTDYRAMAERQIGYAEQFGVETPNFQANIELAKIYATLACAPIALEPVEVELVGDNSHIATLAVIRGNEITRLQKLAHLREQETQCALVTIAQLREKVRKVYEMGPNARAEIQRQRKRAAAANKRADAAEAKLREISSLAMTTRDCEQRLAGKIREALGEKPRTRSDWLPTLRFGHNTCAPGGSAGGVGSPGSLTATGGWCAPAPKAPGDIITIKGVPLRRDQWQALGIETPGGA